MTLHPSPRSPLVLSLLAVALLGAQASSSDAPAPAIPARVKSSINPSYNHWLSAIAEAAPIAISDGDRSTVIRFEGH